VDTDRKISRQVRKILAQPTVSLIDGGVKVPAGAISRIIGPLDCDESIRVLAKRYMKNGGQATDRLIATATADELRYAMTRPTEPEIYDETGKLWRKYSAAAK
jgi:hypothetical protein